MTIRSTQIYKLLLYLYVLIAMPGCSSLLKVATLEPADREEWREMHGLEPFRTNEFAQSAFVLDVESLHIMVNPDLLSALDISNGPLLIPIIPNPFLLVRPFVPHNGKFSIVVFFELRMDPDTCGSPVQTKWTLSPSEASFSFSGGTPTPPSVVVIGKEKGFTGEVDGQFILDPDTVREPVGFERKRGVQFQFNTTYSEVDSFAVIDLGVYKNGFNVKIPPLKLVRRNRIIYIPADKFD